MNNLIKNRKSLSLVCLILTCFYSLILLALTVIGLVDGAIVLETSELVNYGAETRKFTLLFSIPFVLIVLFDATASKFYFHGKQQNDTDKNVNRNMSVLFVMLLLLFRAIIHYLLGIPLKPVYQGAAESLLFTGFLCIAIYSYVFIRTSRRTDT